MNYSLGNMLVNGGSLNADGISLDLQFAADKTLTARKGPTPVFTRASTATFVGSDGLIQSAAINAARFDHDPITLACKGLLIEESRTNLVYNSNALTSAGWLLTNVTGASSDTAPDGSPAFEITETIALAAHNIGNQGGVATNSTSVTSGVAYTLSCFIKKSTGSVDWVQLTGGGAGFGNSQYANFNISTGVVGNFAGLTSGTVPRIEQFPNGWFRCSIVVTATASVGSNNLFLSGIDNTNGTTRLPSYLGSVTNKVKAAMAQAEVGAFPTSYIPTTTGSVVRSADVCSITGADFTGMYNASEGTMLVNAFTPANGDRTVFAADDNTANEMIRLRTEGTNPFFKVTDGGSDLVAIDAGAVVANTPFKLAGAYKLNDFASSINGGAAVTDTSGTIPTVNRMRIGAGQSGNTMCGCIVSARYFKKRLADAKLATITT